jgi:macrodomain Ter protein organizer (MatP/YcbG family)
MKISGIYSITNIVNGKVYIGSAVCIKRRWRQHKHQLHKNKHTNPHLQNAWNKYGEDKFEFLIVEELPTGKVRIVEQQYLDRIKLCPNNYYNIAENVEHSTLGYHHTDETKRKMSLAQRGRIVSEETKKKISESNIGRIVSEKTREKIKKSCEGNNRGEKNYWYGKHRSEETRNKMSESCRGERHHFYGKCHSEETKKKMSDVRKGVIFDKTKYSFINRITKETFTGTIYDFYIKNNRKNMVYGLIDGTVTSYKDWCFIRNLNDIEELKLIMKTFKNRNVIHSFFNRGTKETFVGKPAEFRRKYNLNQPSVSLLTSNKIKSYKSWVLAPDSNVTTAKI